MLSLLDPRSDLARHFDTFFDWPRRQGQPLSPLADIDETENEFVLKVDLPGLKEDDIELTIDQGVLTIRAHRQDETEEKSETRLVRERFYGLFERSFRLGSSVDANSTDASYDDGVLTVRLAKKAEIKPRQIPVSRRAD